MAGAAEGGVHHLSTLTTQTRNAYRRIGVVRSSAEVRSTPVLNSPLYAACSVCSADMASTLTLTWKLPAAATFDPAWPCVRLVMLREATGVTESTAERDRRLMITIEC